MRKILITTSALIAGVMATENNNLTERYEANTLDEVKDIVTEIEKRTGNDKKKKLYIFDCDEVLIHRIGNECGAPHFGEWRQYFLNYFWENEQRRPCFGKYKSIVYRDHIKTLVDQQMPAFVRELQNAGNKCVVLTSKQNEKFKWGVVKTSHEIYKKELEDFGYEFTRNWNKLNPQFFGIKDYHSRCYADGIIYANDGKNSNKSEALSSFLEYAKFDPDIVIFIDDTRRNLDELEMLMSQTKRSYIGIQYTAYTKLPQVKYCFEAVEKLRFEWLEKKSEWLTPDVPGCYKVKGQWTIKEETTNSNAIEDRNFEIEDTTKLCKPQGTTISNNDTSFATLTQSPCEETP